MLHEVHTNAIRDLILRYQSCSSRTQRCSFTKGQLIRMNYKKHYFILYSIIHHSNNLVHNFADFTLSDTLIFTTWKKWAANSLWYVVWEALKSTFLNFLQFCLKSAGFTSRIVQMGFWAFYHFFLSSDISGLE